MPHVRTVLGDIAPESVGFALPHEHTAIALWHIPARWDYWELTPDEAIIGAELARFRELGGTTLVDVTPAAVRASVGALLHLPHARVANIPRAIERLQSNGFFVTGLDGEATVSVFDESCPDGRIAIVTAFTTAVAGARSAK